MRTRVSMVALAAAAMVLGTANPAAAATYNLTYYEQTTSFQFIDGGAPGRSTGDVFNFRAIEFTSSSYSGTVAGEKTGSCWTYAREPDGDWIAECREAITIYGRGTLNTHGVMNQTAFERFERQVLGIVSGGGQFAGARGNEFLVQTRFPDRAKIQLVFRTP